MKGYRTYLVALALAALGVYDGAHGSGWSDVARQLLAAFGLAALRSGVGRGSNGRD